MKNSFEEYISNADKAEDIIGSRRVFTEGWFVILADEYVDTHDESFTKFNKDNLLISMEINAKMQVLEDFLKGFFVRKNKRKI